MSTGTVGAATNAVPEGIDGGRFRQVLGQYPTGVCVVTAFLPGGEPVGLTIGSFSPVSFEPPLVGFLIDRSSNAWARVRAAGTRFCVNILSEGQEETVRTIAAREQPAIADLRWRHSPAGMPVLTDSSAFVDCALEQTYQAGDHDIVIGRVLGLDVEKPIMPLLHFRGGYCSFTPSTMSARDADLVGQLRLVDVVKPVMENLSDKLQSEVTVITRVEDELVVIATVGRAKTAVVPTRVGQRAPFMPPLGGVHAAWAEPGERDAWLNRLGPGIDRDDYEETLVLIRERGYSFGLGHAANAALESAITPPRGGIGTRVHDAVKGVLPLYNVRSLDSTKQYEFRSVTSPVIAGRQGLKFTFTLWGPAGKVGVDVLGRYTRELLATTRRASELVEELVEDDANG